MGQLYQDQDIEIGLAPLTSGDGAEGMLYVYMVHQGKEYGFCARSLTAVQVLAFRREVLSSEGV